MTLLSWQPNTVGLIHFEMMKWILLYRWDMFIWALGKKSSFMYTGLDLTVQVGVSRRMSPGVKTLHKLTYKSVYFKESLL